MNNEQGTLGDSGLQPVASDNNDTRPTSRSDNGDGLAEVEIDGEINEKSETERVDLSSGVTGRTLVGSDADMEPDSGRKAAGGNGDAGAVNNENSPVENQINSTGEKSADQQNQQVTGSANSTGEKKGRGRPKKANSEKPFSPKYYEWRDDSGGWKLIRRYPQSSGKLGYEYVGFLNPKRWAFFRRFNDEQFIKAVTAIFEKRKQGRSVRIGRLRLVGQRNDESTKRAAS